MTGSMALRLFWKEYRAQRGLWLSLAIGAVLFHALIRALSDGPSGIDDALWLITGLLTFCFAVGAASVTFAQEREEGTHLRLLSLAPSPTVVFFVKLLVIILASAALATVTGFSALLISERWYDTTISGAILSPPMRLSVWIAAGVSLGMFFSLVFRHVFAALLSGALTAVIAMLIVSAVWEAHEDYFRTRITETIPESWYWQCIAFNSLVGGVILTLFVVDLVLVHRWLKRAFFDDAPSRIRFWVGQTRVRKASAEGGVTLELGVQSDLTTPVLSPEEAVIQPAPRLSLSWLYVSWGRRGLRPFRFLRWKELAETRIAFSIGVCVVAALAIAGTASTFRPPDGAHFILLFGIPSVMGLLAFRSEQKHERYRLLADHGLSPRTVWLSKHAVWLPRTIGLMLLVFVVTDFLHTGRHVWSDIAYGVYCFDVSGKFHNDHYSYFSQAVLGETPAIRCIIVSLLLYGIGQWASMTFRKGVIASFATILGCILTGLWLTFCSSGGIPLLFAVLPLVPALLLFTWKRTATWLIDDQQRRVWLVPGLVLASGLAACVALPGIFRVVEIPSVTASQIDRVQLSSDEINEVRAPFRSEEPVTAGMYREAADGIRNVDNSLLRQLDTWQWSSVSPRVRQWVEDNSRYLALIREAAARPSCKFRGTHASTDLHVVVHLVVQNALIEASEGDHDAALDSFRTAFTVCRHRAGRGDELSSWVVARQLSRLVLQAMSWWATQPDIDADRIAQATDIIRTHIAELPNVSFVAFGTHDLLRNLVATGPDAIAEYAGPDWRYDSDPTHRWLYRFPGEQARMQRIVNYSDAMQAQMVVDVSGLDRGEVLTDLDEQFRSLKSQELGLKTQLDRWERTTPTLRRVTMTVVSLCTRDEIATRTQAAATIAIMHLLLAERRDGKLPETLDDLPGGLHDPWTGQPLAWYPQGIPEPLSATTVTVALNHPFLFSAGPTGAHIVRNEYQVADYGAGGAGMMSGSMEAGSSAAPASPGLGGAAVDPPPPAADGEADNQPDPEGAADTTEPEIETVVAYYIQDQHTVAGELPTVFMLPRPQTDDDE